MRAVRYLLALTLLAALPFGTARAQAPERYSSNEILDAGHRFFGGVSRGLAQIVERAFSTWGQPMHVVARSTSNHIVTVSNQSHRSMQ